MQQIDAFANSGPGRAASPDVPENPPAICAELFPFTQEAVYLDTGSAGLSFTGQGAAAAAFYDVKARGYVAQNIWKAKADAVRARLAPMLDIGAEEIEFFSGTTAGLNLVGYGVAWRPGDEVVVAEDEFPSVRMAWRGAERAGAIIRQVPIENEACRQEALEAAVNDRTRVLVAAHVHSNAGTRLDLVRLGKRCREHDALFVVDGIHALGAIPVDLSPVDIYTAGVFKWLLSGFGLSVFICRPRAADRMSPAFRGYLNQPPENGLQFAHANYPGLYPLDAALDLLGERIGWDVVHARTAALADWLAQDLAAGGIDLVAPAGARSGCVCFPVPDSEALKAHLAERNIFAAAKGPYMRATPFFYNSREDVQSFASEVLRFIR